MSRSTAHLPVLGRQIIDPDTDILDRHLAATFLQLVLHLHQDVVVPAARFQLPIVLGPQVNEQLNLRHRPPVLFLLVHRVDLHFAAFFQVLTTARPMDADGVPLFFRFR